MKKLLLPALLAITLTANAAETLKTPYGTLAFSKDRIPGTSQGHILLDSKPIGEFTDYGNLDFMEKRYNLNQQDIYIFSSRGCLQFTHSGSQAMMHPKRTVLR